MLTISIATVRDHMIYLGLNPRSKFDRRRYAELVDSKKVNIPRQLRGLKADKKTGYCWERREEYIAKHKYGVSLHFVASVLAGFQGDTSYCVLKFHKSDDFIRYLVSLPGKVEAAYVSVGMNRQNGLKTKILKVVPMKLGFSLMVE